MSENYYVSGKLAEQGIQAAKIASSEFENAIQLVGLNIDVGRLLGDLLISQQPPHERAAMERMLLKKLSPNLRLLADTIDAFCPSRGV